MKLRVSLELKDEPDGVRTLYVKEELHSSRKREVRLCGDGRGKRLKSHRSMKDGAYGVYDGKVEPKHFTLP